MEVRSEGVLGSPIIARPRVRRSRQLRRVAHSAVVVAGAACMVLIVLVALLADSIAPQLPDEQNFDLIEAGPGAQAWFGTDRFGRGELITHRYSLEDASEAFRALAAGELSRGVIVF